MIDLQEDPLHSSDVINSTFPSLIQSSIVKQIHEKESSEGTVCVFFCQIIPEKYLFTSVFLDCIANNKKKVDFDDSIEMINRNGSSPKAAANFHSTSYENNIYTKISHVSE